MGFLTAAVGWDGESSRAGVGQESSEQGGPGGQGSAKSRKAWWVQRCVEDAAREVGVVARHGGAWRERS